MAIPQKSNEIQSLSEAAIFLQVSEKTLWLEAKAGRVPHFRVGKQFRFVRSELLEWARSCQVGKPAQSRDPYLEQKLEFLRQLLDASPEERDEILAEFFRAYGNMKSGDSPDA